MKLNDAFPSKYLKADDLKDGDVTLTVKSLDFETVKNKEGKDESKPVMQFRERSTANLATVKPIILNKTNWKSIEKVYGAESDDWIGKPITLFVMDVDAFGETQPAIRIKVPKSDNGNHSGPSLADLRARYGERMHEAKQLGVKAEPLPDNATAEEIITAGKVLKAAIDKANDF